MVNSKRFRECSAPTSVTNKEGGLHVGSVGTVIASWIIYKVSLTTTGNWMKLRGVGIQIQRMHLGINT